jgi:hypothetical protein
LHHEDEAGRVFSGVFGNVGEDPVKLGIEVGVWIVVEGYG